jgi:hypothetical protein
MRRIEARRKNASALRFNRENHCRCAAQAFMHAAEIVVRNIEAHSCRVVFDFFAKAVGYSTPAPGCTREGQAYGW